MVLRRCHFHIGAPDARAHIISRTTRTAFNIASSALCHAALCGDVPTEISPASFSARFLIALSFSPLFHCWLILLKRLRWLFFIWHGSPLASALPILQTFPALFTVNVAMMVAHEFIIYNRPPTARIVIAFSLPPRCHYRPRLRAIIFSFSAAGRRRAFTRRGALGHYVRAFRRAIIGAYRFIIF